MGCGGGGADFLFLHFNVPPIEQWPQEERRERERGMIYSFRPLTKGCRWMTYHLTVHTIIIPMNKKTIKLTTVCLNYDIEMLRNLKALYKYSDRFLTIFSLVDASSRLKREREIFLSLAL